MSTPIGIIHNFVEALTTTSKTGTAAVDEALKAVGAKNYLTFKANFVSAQSGLSTEQFLKKYCGIDITNTDVGAITGSDASGKASGKTTKTAENIVPESSKLKEPTDEQYSSFTKNGLKVNVTYEFDSYGDANYSYSRELYLLKQLIVTRAL